MSERPGSLPRAHGEAVLRGRIRSLAEDFFVEELPSFEPSGSGEHLLLTVEKRGINTAFAAKRIGEWAGIGEIGIGYAGLKDRHAVTRQRFSVHLPKRVAPDLAALTADDAEAGERGEYLRVLEQHWHAKKLPRGALAGNRFVLVLRDVEGDPAAIEARLRAIAEQGVPNYFGEQRFGREGDNIGAAVAMFAGRRVRREQRGMLLSAARSELFNRVLAARVQAGSWRGIDAAGAILAGEVWMLAGSRSVFGPEPVDEVLAQRVAGFDIHPTGPLWGAGPLRSAGAVADLEATALAGDTAARLRAGLERAGLKQERRALRLVPDQLVWRWRDPTTFEIGFALPAGTYATVVLAELGIIDEPGRTISPR